MKNAPMEKTITNQILKYLNALPSTYCWKVHGGMYGKAGIADIIGVWNGRCIAVEVKRPGKEPTSLQDDFLYRVAVCGGFAVCAHSVDELRAQMVE